MNRPRSPDRRKCRIAAAIILVPLLGALTVETAGAARNTRRAVVVRRDFQVKITQDEQSTTAGGSAIFPVVFSSTGNFNSTVFFDLPNLAGGLDGRIRSLGSNRYELVISTSPVLPTGSGVYKFSATGGGIQREALFRLNIQSRPSIVTTTVPSATTAPPITGSFGIGLINDSRTVNPGELAQWVIAVDRKDFARDVTFRVEGVPANTTANFAPNPTTGGTVLYVQTTPNTVRGTYLLAVFATAGNSDRAVVVRLTVRRAADFGLSVAPSAVTVPAGNNAVMVVNVQGVGNTAAPDVDLEVLGLPAGTEARFSSLPAAGPTVLTITTQLTTPAGTYPLTIVAKSGDVTRNVPASLVVRRNAPAFGLSAQPSALAVARGVEGTIEVSITRSGGFTGAVGFEVRGTPQGVEVLAQPGPSATTLRVRVGAGVPIGNYPLQIIGVNGSLAATVVVNLAVI